MPSQKKKNTSASAQNLTPFSCQIYNSPASQIYFFELNIFQCNILTGRSTKVSLTAVAALHSSSCVWLHLPSEGRGSVLCVVCWVLRSVFWLRQTVLYTTSPFTRQQEMTCYTRQPLYLLETQSPYGDLHMQSPSAFPTRGRLSDSYLLVFVVFFAN